ncbi:MAG: T9SS type A sorting domain-containing protein, partial [Bacteroidia bacterium]|nr:T9SS type A sorting domain-containing protein [Bacteroidia bacterium]
EVRVTNPATNAVTSGNVNSYVQGRLRRYIDGAPGAYDFPVGTSSYQRATVNFTAVPGVHNLLAWFNNWGGVPPTPPNPTAECGAQYHSCQMLNNGYWTINAYAADLTTQLTTSGAYTLTLYNTGATPCAGASQFGVLKNTGTGWVIQNPGCHANGSAATVSRPGMSGFSDFGTGQSPQPLPVYLLRWEGAVRADGSHHLRWDVTEEGARVSYFVVEVGRTPEALAPWRRFEREVREAVRLDPPVGSSFYRLRIHTSEGAEIHSNVLELRREAPPVSLERLEAFPNPTTGALTVRFWVNSLEPIRVSLWNALGQVVRERPITPAETGLIELQFSLSDLAAGPYLLRVEQGDALRTRLIWKE